MDDLTTSVAWVLEKDKTAQYFTGGGQDRQLSQLVGWGCRQYV